MANILYAINFFAGFLAAVLAGIIYFKPIPRRVAQCFGILALTNLIYGTLHVLWFFGLPVDFGDVSVIISFLTVVESFVLFGFVYNAAENKNLLYLMLFYVMSLLFIFSFGSYLFSFILSHIFVFSLFLYFILSEPKIKKAGYFAVIYSVISFIWMIIVLADNSIILWHFLPRFFLVMFLYFMLRNAGSISAREKIKRTRLVFVKHLIVIVALANLLFISTVGVHEAGHIIAAKVFGCEKIKTVVYEEKRNEIGIVPYTELLCKDTSYHEIILLSGIFLPILVSVVLFFVGNGFIKKLAVLMLGFSLLIAYGDLRVMNMSESVITAILLLGGVILVGAIVYLARIEDN